MRLMFLFVIGVVMMPAAAGAVVPRVLAYQSVFYDGGGNLLGDGPADATFRITDEGGSILYEERQRIQVMRGSAAVLVGNGQNADGAPTGGIPDGIFDGDGQRFLHVGIDGEPDIGPLEIASVPFAITAERAQGVVESSIDSAAIADGSIAYEDLSGKLIEKLAADITGGKEIVYRDELESIYRRPEAASGLGVERGFNYSGAADVQGVLKDIDRAVRSREDDVRAEGELRSAAVASEADARASGDAMMAESIGAESKARAGADSSLQAAVDSEASSRSSADAAIQSEVDSIKSGQQVIERIEVSGDLNIAGAVDGVDISTHDHSGPGTGGFLFPGAIWFDAGARADGEIVALPVGYGPGNCAVTAAFARMKDGFAVEGVDNLCTKAEWVHESAFKVRCVVHGGAQGTTCAELFAGVESPLPCVASYTAICAKR